MESERRLLANMSIEEQRDAVGFFELLMKVDKRQNPDLYTPKPKEPILSNFPLSQTANLMCEE